jgi:hypothetical protein
LPLVTPTRALGRLGRFSTDPVLPLASVGLDDPSSTGKRPAAAGEVVGALTGSQRVEVVVADR